MRICPELALLDDASALSFQTMVQFRPREVDLTSAAPQENITFL